VSLSDNISLELPSLFGLARWHHPLRYAAHSLDRCSADSRVKEGTTRSSFLIRRGGCASRGTRSSWSPEEIGIASGVQFQRKQLGLPRRQKPRPCWPPSNYPREYSNIGLSMVSPLALSDVERAGGLLKQLTLGPTDERLGRMVKQMVSPTPPLLGNLAERDCGLQRTEDTFKARADVEERERIRWCSSFGDFLKLIGAPVILRAGDAIKQVPGKRRVGTIRQRLKWR
jgi:hypothetical protein